MKLIVATNNLGYIGKDGKMLWYSSDDLKHFKQLTTGCSLIVGATTFEICLNGKLLPNRETFILGKKYKSIWEILGTICRLAQEEKDIWVIGGSMVYNTFIYVMRFISPTSITMKLVTQNSCYQPIIKENYLTIILRKQRDDKGKKYWGW